MAKPQGEKKPAAITVGSFGDTAKSLSRSPLGIIALFIVLIYGFATLLLGATATSLTDELKRPIVWFLVLFPILVLAVFAWLVACHHTKLYGPGDFVDQKHFLALQDQLRTAQRRFEVLSELAPEVVLPSFMPAATITASVPPPASVPDDDDPQRGKWGGKREANFRKVTVEPIRPLRSDPDNYRIALEVHSTDPQGHPLTGKVRFHLHDSFSPDLEEMPVRNGVAKLSIVAYGAFTVGVDTDDGTKLEINLADPDIDAPREFKDS